MKILNQIRHAITMIVFVVFAVSCEDQSKELISTEPNPEEMSEISLLEEESGIKFFKLDIPIFDEKGENEILMRIASKDEDMLEHYLASFEISIEPIYSTAYPNNKPVQKKEDVYPDDQNTLDIDGIFIEVINSNLVSGVIGFTTKVKQKKQVTENAKLLGNGYDYDVTFTSGKWPELFQITAYNQVGFKFKGKSRWYSGWSTRTFCSIYYPNPCQSYWNLFGSNEYDIDGPYKVQVIIDYNNVNDFAIQFIDL